MSSSREAWIPLAARTPYVAPVRPSSATPRMRTGPGRDVTTAKCREGGRLRSTIFKAGTVPRRETSSRNRPSARIFADPPPGRVSKWIRKREKSPSRVAVSPARAASSQPDARPAAASPERSGDLRQPRLAPARRPG